MTVSFLGARYGNIVACAALVFVASPTVLTAQQVSTRAFGGYGTTSGYGAGLGADVGIQFPMPILVPLPVFVGAWGVYHFGEEFFDQEPGQQVKQTMGLFGLEVAGIWLQDPIYIRGNGIIGAARVSRAIAGQPNVEQTNFLLSGGFILGRRFGSVVVGVEPHFPLVIGSDLTGAAFALYVTIGYAGAPK
jgi:hypothetical protein